MQDILSLGLNIKYLLTLTVTPGAIAGSGISSTPRSDSCSDRTESPRNAMAAHKRITARSRKLRDIDVGVL